MRSSGNGYEMSGHDGGTIGHFTYLRTYPEKGVAYSLLTNSPSVKLFEDIEAELMPSLVGTRIPPEPPAESFSPDFARYLGRYENIAAEYTLSEKDGKLSAHTTSKTGLAPEMRVELEPYREDVFILRAKNNPVDGQKVFFVGDENGKKKFVRIGVRMLRRVPG
jgi:hypothetical protein